MTPFQFQCLCVFLVYAALVARTPGKLDAPTLTALRAEAIADARALAALCGQSWD